ncbi:SDR family oxidoreductase [Faecalibaculum rodentium]|jgi:NAD(P)-dependent dehydrogenase (short-subunit alcohol dehydrogenase family)|uniref:SDR family oxidoreductase n=1 Tax=Faecalibaculum rodentium TaxID=1702221 RepID=UPI00256F4644|nr:SDR family oxidoreductase [Faecalibaculum rodentium]
MKLKDKSIVVTGASSGMGKAIVELFVKEGGSVIAVARRKERLEALAESLKNEAVQVQVFAGDVSRQEDCEGMIDAAVAAYGRLDIPVNNAGVMGDMAPIAEVSDEKFRQVMDVNVYGPMAAMRKAVQVFLEQGQGRNIINVSSVSASHQSAGPIYGASKAALNALSRNTAYMYKGEKIRVNVIAPGGINTEIATAMGRPNMDGYTWLGPVLKLSPAPGEATDIAQCALLLASDDSAYTSGDIIAVDGGWTSF